MSGRRFGRHGFTLLELLISITLISVIVVILSMSMKTALRAYIRGREANREIVTVAAVQGLLGRQLVMCVRPGTSATAKFFRFRGEDDELVFTTTHAPMGAQAGGIFLVVYKFQSEDESLLYAQRIVTSPEERKADPPGRLSVSDLKKVREEGWEISVVPGIESLEFSYLGRDGDMTPDEVDNWPSAWIRDGRLPRAVGVVIRYKDAESGREHETRLVLRVPVWKAEEHRQIFGP